MKKIIIVYILILCGVFNFQVEAATTRISDNHAIGWYNYSGTYKVANKISLHTDFAFRRVEVIKKWQQSFLAFDVSYQLNPKVTLRTGYAWLETFPYGDIPLNSMGKQFTEHRMYQMAILSDQVSRFKLTNRFMLEQRWVGKYSNVDLKKENEYTYLNRIRYMFRIDTPLKKGKNIVDKTPYISLYNEVFMGLGKNVGENIFDQNRLSLLLGYKFNSMVKLEAGYLSQIVELGREVDGNNVIQHNNGLIFNAIFNFNLMKPKEAK